MKPSISSAFGFSSHRWHRAALCLFVRLPPTWPRWTLAAVRVRRGFFRCGVAGRGDTDQSGQRHWRSGLQQRAADGIVQVHPGQDRKLQYHRFTPRGFATTEQKRSEVNVQHRRGEPAAQAGFRQRKVEVSAAAPLPADPGRFGWPGRRFATASTTCRSTAETSHSWRNSAAGSELSPSGHSRQRGQRRFRRQWLPSGAEQLHAGWYRQQL